MCQSQVIVFGLINSVSGLFSIHSYLDKSRIVGKMKKANSRSISSRIGILATSLGLAFCWQQTASAQESTVVEYSDALKVRMHLQAGINAVSERRLFWDLPAIFAPTANYDTDKDWLEYYVKPGISFEHTGPWVTTYGKISMVASATKGIDAYEFGDTGRVTLEEAYLGFRVKIADDSEFDLSVGPRELKLGTGMLVANGGSSGFERGALKFGPRKAWEKALIARLKTGPAQLTGFYIDPNEMPSTNSYNELAGADFRIDDEAGGYAGLTYVHVINSESSYPQVLPAFGGIPTITPGAREGLNALNFYGRTNPIISAAGSSFLALDAAAEWNDDIDMKAWAGRFQAGHTWTDVTWTPSMVYSFQTFSGDDPNTTRQERFDPLYYEGSPSSWATGSKSSMTFINSNVQAHQLALSVKPTPMDTFTLRFAHIRVNELRSPIQFGQATRIDLAGGSNIVTGVTDPHLADDIFLEYNRIINRNTFLTAGISASLPGKGIELAAGRELPVWYGGFVNLVVNY